MGEILVFGTQKNEERLTDVVASAHFQRLLSKKVLPCPILKPARKNPHMIADILALEDDLAVGRLFIVPPPVRITISLETDRSFAVWYFWLVRKLAHAAGFLGGEYACFHTHAIALPEDAEQRLPHLSEVLYRFWDCPVEAHASVCCYHLLPESTTLWTHEQLDELDEDCEAAEQMIRARRLKHVLGSLLGMSANLCIAQWHARAFARLAPALAEGWEQRILRLTQLREPMLRALRQELLARSLLGKVEQAMTPDAYLLALEKLFSTVFGRACVYKLESC